MHQHPADPTKKSCPLATSRLNTGWVDPVSTETTRATPPSVRTESPGFRSRAMTQPFRAFQSRWMAVVTTVSPPSATRSVSEGGLWWTATTGW